MKNKTLPHIEIARMIKALRVYDRRQKFGMPSEFRKGYYKGLITAGRYLRRIFCSFKNENRDEPRLQTNQRKIMKTFFGGCLMTIIVAGVVVNIGLFFASEEATKTSERMRIEELNVLHQRINSMATASNIAFEIAMENSNRLSANLEATEDFADALQHWLNQFEARAVLDGRSTPLGKAPGWPTMRPMVYAQWRTNASGLLFLEIKEAGR